jgi:hypothetical protein
VLSRLTRIGLPHSREWQGEEEHYRDRRVGERHGKWKQRSGGCHRQEYLSHARQQLSLEFGKESVPVSVGQKRVHWEG